MPGELSHLDLFSGIGGFTLAAEWAGFQTIGFAEIEPFCCKILKQHWPHIKNYGSVDNAESFRELRGRVTVLSAGVPCQPASLAGKRRGSGDHRWKWPATLDIIKVVRPTFTLFENPPGILSLGEFGGVLLRLADLGYQVRLFGVPANAIGAKHRRQRVFIVANAGGRRCDRPEEGEDQQPRGTETVGTSEVVAHAGQQLPTGRNERRDEVSAGPCTDVERSGENSETLADADDSRLQGRDSGELRECAGQRVIGQSSPSPVGCGNGGSLSVNFVENLMGFPKNWTNIP